MKRGTHHTPEARAKNAAAQMGNKNAEGSVRSPETRAKLRAASTNPSAETRAKNRAAHLGPKNPFFGKHHSEEAKAKNRAAATGKHPSEETRAKLRAAHAGKHPSEETKAKLRAAHTGKHHSEEMKARCRAAKLGPKHPNWMGGVSRDPYGWDFNDELKEEVRRRDGYKCQLCGTPQAECRRAMAVHHINYDKKDSDPLNLVALCVSCNIKVNKNREHWTAFFQAMAIRRAIAELRKSQ